MQDQEFLLLTPNQKLRFEAVQRVKEVGHTFGNGSKSGEPHFVAMNILKNFMGWSEVPVLETIP